MLTFSNIMDLNKNVFSIIPSASGVFRRRKNLPTALSRLKHLLILIAQNCTILTPKSKHLIKVIPQINILFRHKVFYFPMWHCSLL